MLDNSKLNRLKANSISWEVNEQSGLLLSSFARNKLCNYLQINQLKQGSLLQQITHFQYLKQFTFPSLFDRACLRC